MCLPLLISLLTLSMGGYKRQTYNQKRWLIGVANKVKARSLTYAGQLKQCEDELNRGWLMKLFF